jgi:hypothetical protein
MISERIRQTDRTSDINRVGSIQVDGSFIDLNVIASEGQF